MKFNKNSIQIFMLLISAFGLMFTMLSMITHESLFQNDNILVLELAVLLVMLTSLMYALLVIKRIKPKKYIYISYTVMNKEIAEKASLVLSEQFKSLSKYRFEIITADSIPFGNDIYTTMQENMLKSDVVIIIVSPSYLKDDWCLKEFMAISEEKKLIIPIVTEALSDLKKLPKDISNIKAVSLINCKSEEDFSKVMATLAKDLIKRRKD